MNDISATYNGGIARTRQNSTHSTASPDDRSVAGLIARLLLHFWTPQDLPDRARKAMAEDWLVDLREFGPEIVAIACGEWRRANSRRPTIADIRLLCIAAQRERREAEPVYLPGPEVSGSREMRAAERGRRHWRDQLEGRARANEWAQRQGYSDLDAYAAGERVHISEAYRRVIAEIIAGSPIASGMESVAEQLGVKVREYTPEEMRAGRIALGLETAEEDA